MFLLMFVTGFWMFSSVLTGNCDTEYDAAYGCDHIYGNVTETRTNIRSVIECAEHCNENDQCTAVQYNPLSMTCRLNSGRYFTMLSTDCQLTFRYAKLSKKSCGQLIHDGCTVSSECSVTHSMCADDKCQCDHGYSYNHRTETCVTECDVYGSTFTRQIMQRLAGHNHKTIKDVDSINFCKQACAEETDFTCRSADYRYDKKFCLLSTDTALMAPLDYKQDSLFDHFHRNCQ